MNGPVNSLDESSGVFHYYALYDIGNVLKSIAAMLHYLKGLAPTDYFEDIALFLNKQPADRIVIELVAVLLELVYIDYHGVYGL